MVIDLLYYMLASANIPVLFYPSRRALSSQIRNSAAIIHPCHNGKYYYEFSMNNSND